MSHRTSGTHRRPKVWRHVWTLALFLLAAGGLAAAPLSAEQGHKRFDDTTTFWDFLTAEVIEFIPLTYPDTQAAYLLKDLPPDPDVAYRIEFVLPYGSYSSTTIYQDTKPFSALRDSEYVLGVDFLHRKSRRHRKPWYGKPWHGKRKTIANPYQPGNLVNTPKDLRKVVIFLTPDFERAVRLGAANPLAMATTGSRILIMQRVYYANRSNPETGRPFFPASDFDRLGYTFPQRIQCVDPKTLRRAVKCPRFNPLQDFPVIDFNIEAGRTPPPFPPANCPARLRWDRPQLEAVHWAGPGGLDNSGSNPPDPRTSCTGYLLSMLPLESDGNGGKRLASVVMTRVETPPSFFDITKLDDDPYFPNIEPDTRYIGIQNYGTSGGDVRYNQQSRAVGEIVKHCPDGVVGPECQERTAGFEWIFLHYTRPIAEADREVIEDWAAANSVNQQQLAIWKDDPTVFHHPPFMIYRQKETSQDFKDNSPGYVRANVPCFSWEDGGGDATMGGWGSSPISNAADFTNMGSYVPVSVTCNFADPGNLHPGELDACLTTLLTTDPSWGENGANCTP